MNMKKYGWLLLSGLMLAACENTVDLELEPKVQVPVDFSNYVAIGNSLTAGYADGGVYAESQAYSFPSMIAMKMKEADPSMPEFTQPTITGAGSGYLRLNSLVNNSPEIVPVPAADGWFNKVSGFPFNNMGVPGIRVLDITVNGYGASPTAGNPYFFRMLPESAAMTSYLEAVVGADPTFFTCWLGNNDVLGYATSGGAAGVNGAPGTFLGGLTPVPAFQASYEGLIGALTADGTTKGVVATIPNVTAIPFFTTIPGKLLPLDEATANAVNTGYAQFNGGVMAWNAAIDGQGLPAALKRETINMTAGANYPVIIDESLSNVTLPNPSGGDPIVLPKIRQLHEGELLLLTLPQAELLTGLGTQTPIPSQYTLTASELASIKAATDAFNGIIRNVAASNSNVVLWDASAAFDTFLANFKATGVGYAQHGVSINPSFITGAAFSLDGVHATPRGYAWAANNFIQTINDNFGTRIGLHGIGQFRGVKLP
jgi:lysophospholipase L1-like esterase